MQRLGLLGPLVRAHRRIEQWDDTSGSTSDLRFPAPASLRTLGPSGRAE
jgi:hypothetical protein